MPSRPSRHLSWTELRCKDGTPYPMAYRTDPTRLPRLAYVFELIRYVVGHLPISNNSAYRSPSHNRRIGGARKSQHVEGRAMDLVPPKGWTTREFHAVIRDSIPEVRGLGRYRGFVHVDVRPGRRWMPTKTQGGKKDS